MARTIERAAGVGVAEPPVILVPPETSLPAPTPRDRRTISRIAQIGRWASAGLAAIGIAQSGVVPTALDALSEFLKSRENNVAARMARESRSLGPLPGQEASWWMELPEERIRQLAQLPEINQIGDKYVPTVSPALQKKAQQAGYKLIYQGDPEDTVGRTVIATGRQIDTDWSSEDLGFGRGGTKIRGIFQVWVPDPADPQQINKVYALLEDPTNKKKFLALVDLYQFDPNKTAGPELPTYFGVDNLAYGPDYIREKSDATGQSGSSGPMRLTSVSVPDPEDPPSKKWKKINIDFPTFHTLLRGDNHELSNIAKSGDYVTITLRVRSAPPLKFWDDERGVARAGLFAVRRLGGFKQWQSEIHK